MITLPLILCADTSSASGRQDCAALSQQSLMEMVIEYVQNKKPINRGTRNIKDLSEWTGVSVNESGEVTEIHWTSLAIGGSLALEWFPSTVVDITISTCKVTGSVLFESLPPSLETLSITHENFEGTIALENAPLTMNQITLTNNNLSGSLNLERLPPRLQILSLNRNSFIGTVCLTELPETLESINLARNLLSGPLDLTALPQKMHHLSLDGNRFVGSTDFSKLPKSLLWLSVSENTNLSGKINIWSNKQEFVITGTNITDIHQENAP